MVLTATSSLAAKFTQPGGGYQEANNVVDNYADNTWMGGFTGSVYHVRLYSSVLHGSLITRRPDLTVAIHWMLPFP